MSFLKGLAGPLAGGLGGAINPASGLGMVGGPLSGLGALKALFGGHGGDDKGGGSDPAKTIGSQSGVPQVNPGYTPPQPNAAASGLGKMIGVDPGKISSIATSVGRGMNQIAEAGGAQGGYAAAPELPTVNNHMQLLDPKILEEIIRHFSGRGQIQ